jgi:hypothetical protein
MKAACLVILCGLSCAYAGPITFQFTGIVTQVPLDDIYGDIAFGNSFEGSFTFESATPDLIPDDGSTGSYTMFGLPYGMTITVAGHNFSASDSLNIGVSTFALADIYTVLAMSPDLTLELFLLDISATALTSDSLPLSPPALANFGVADFHLHQRLDLSEVQVDGQLFSLTCVAGCDGRSEVPEPGTAVMFCAGVVILIVLHRKLRYSQR